MTPRALMSFVRDERGLSSTEYGLVTALIVVSALVALAPTHREITEALRSSLDGIQGGHGIP